MRGGQVHSSSCSSDRAPQILDLPSTMEWNLNSSPRILCSASGNPLPSHTSIELRKLDSTVLKVSGGRRRRRRRAVTPYRRRRRYTAITLFTHTARLPLYFCTFTHTWLCHILG